MVDSVVITQNKLNLYKKMSTVEKNLFTEFSKKKKISTSEIPKKLKVEYVEDAGHEQNVHMGKGCLSTQKIRKQI